MIDYHYLATCDYNSGSQFNIYRNGGAVIHGHMFSLYYGRKHKFNYNQSLN